MIEVFLFGTVLGLISITLAGLLVTAYLQYRQKDQNRNEWKMPLELFGSFVRETTIVDSSRED